MVDHIEADKIWKEAHEQHGVKDTYYLLKYFPDAYYDTLTKIAGGGWCHVSKEAFVWWNKVSPDSFCEREYQRYRRDSISQGEMNLALNRSIGEKW